MSDAFLVRRLRTGDGGADLDAVARVWHRAMRAAYAFLRPGCLHSLDEDRAFLRDRIVPRCRVWVCAEYGAVRGYLAMQDDGYVERLYVDPDHQRRGIGRALLAQARRESPDVLRLHTHQRNWPAREFYAREGFRAEAFGLSPPPEEEPDVLYVWRRDDDVAATAATAASAASAATAASAASAATGTQAAAPPRPPASYSPTWFRSFAAAIDPSRTALETEFLARHLPVAAFPRVLDIPCGLGRHAAALADRGHDVTAADLDPDAVAAAHAALGGRGRALVADLRDLAHCGGPFDALVNLWQSFGHFDDATNAAVLEGMARRVRPGGRVIVDVYDLGRFAPANGARTRRRAEGDVAETSGFDGRRLHVRLAYSWSTDTDAFDWRLYDRAEFRALAASAGLRVVAESEDFGAPPLPGAGVPRVQYVLARSDQSSE